MTSLVNSGTCFVCSEVVRVLLGKGEERPTVFGSNAAKDAANNWKLVDVADQMQFIAGDLSDISHVLDAVMQAQPSVIYRPGSIDIVPPEKDS